MRPSLKRFAAGDFVRHGAIVFAASVAVNGCNYIFHVMNSRHLGVVAYGDLASLVAAMTLLSFPATALSLGITKLAAELHAMDDSAGLRRLVDVSVRWSLIAGVALIIVVSSTLPWSMHFLRINDALAVVLASLALAMNLLLPVLRSVLQGAEDFGAFARSVVIEGVFKVALGVALPYGGYGVDGALCGFVAGALIAIIYAIVALRPHIAAYESRLVVDVRRLVETASGVGATSLAFAVLGFADVVAVKHFVDPDQAGLYGALSLVGKIFFFAVAFIPQVVLPKVARRNVAGHESGHYLRYAVSVIAVLGALGVGICAVAPTLIIRIVAGGAFVAVAPLVVPYTVAMTALAAANTGAMFRLGTHRLGFAGPLLIVTVTEVVAFCVAHGSLWEIVRTVLVGHLCVALVTFYGASDRSISARRLAVEAAA